MQKESYIIRMTAKILNILFRKLNIDSGLSLFVPDIAFNFLRVFHVKGDESDLAIFIFRAETRQDIASFDDVLIKHK
ncbi:hypothetical protein D3C73_1264210 [compost metagenome]